jgi:hypothetical protein
MQSSDLTGKLVMIIIDSTAKLVSCSQYSENLYLLCIETVVIVIIVITVFAGVFPTAYAFCDCSRTECAHCSEFECLDCCTGKIPLNFKLSSNCMTEYSRRFV